MYSAANKHGWQESQRVRRRRRQPVVETVEQIMAAVIAEIHAIKAAKDRNDETLYQMSCSFLRGIILH